MLKTLSIGSVLLATGWIACAIPVNGVSAQGSAGPPPRWEYRAMTKQQLLDLGDKDLTAGLNQLGDAGWELIAIDSVYIFKRDRDRGAQYLAEVRQRLSSAESDAKNWQDRSAWSERMFRKGLLSENQAKADRAALNAAELAVESARKELDALLIPTPKKAPGKDTPPAK
jgi:hypothetical protein